jgi:hypothetical protein
VELSRQIEVSRAARDAFRDVANFENAPEWDPEIAESNPR